MEDEKETGFGDIMNLFSLDEWVYLIIELVFDKKHHRKMKTKYQKNKKLQRFIKYGFSIAVQYWLIRAPLTWWMTEKWNIHYLVSSFMIGTLLTIGGFFISDIWVWGDKK